MSGNPVIEFGLGAVAIGYSARAGRVSPWDVAQFLATALRCVPSDETARAMVLRFHDSVRAEALAAGRRLIDEALTWLDDAHPELRGQIGNTTPAGVEFAWQQRKDCGHD